MMNIEISTSPFELMDHIHTRLVADGDPHWFDGRNNRLYRHVVCMPMTRWLMPYVSGAPVRLAGIPERPFAGSERAGIPFPLLRQPGGI